MLVTGRSTAWIALTFVAGSSQLVLNVAAGANGSYVRSLCSHASLLVRRAEPKYVAGGFRGHDAGGCAIQPFFC